VFEFLASLQPTPSDGSSTPALSPARNPILLLLLIIETVLATLAGVHTHPASALDCGLQSRWQTLYRAKDERHIRAIQDRFDCCGLRSTSDMPWPFPSSEIDVRTCSTRFERTRSCLANWRSEEQSVANMLLAVNVLVMLWQAVVVYGFLPDANLLRRWIGGRRTDERESRRAIGFGEEGERYLDGPETGVERDGEGDVRLIQDEESGEARDTQSNLISFS